MEKLNACGQWCSKLFWPATWLDCKNIELAGYKLADVKLFYLLIYTQTMCVVLLKMEKLYFQMQLYMHMSVKLITG